VHGPDWTCLGEGPEHPADVAEIERTYDRRSTVIAIQRCGTCGQLYRFEQYELNDWSGGSDYCDQTWTWQVLAPDEVAIVRGDPNYTPRDGREHRHDSGWKREGP
jgi:hypothetical protein